MTYRSHYTEIPEDVRRVIGEQLIGSYSLTADDVGNAQDVAEMIWLEQLDFAPDDVLVAEGVRITVHDLADYIRTYPTRK